MFRSLYFKIVLILVIFIITVMSVVAAVLLFSVFQYYNGEFQSQMEDAFAEGAPLVPELEDALGSENYAAEQKKVLDSYSGLLGIDSYRNFYVLDMNGRALAGSDTELARTLTATPNMMAALNKKTGYSDIVGSDYADFAYYLSNGEHESIIYIKDTFEEVQQLSWILFSLILQALFLGLLISIVLSFFLAKAITAPIQKLTRGASLVAAGDFSCELEAHSRDEIGTLTDTFNHMKDVLKVTLDEVDGEREKLETVFACLKDAVIVFTDSGEVLQSNPSAAELFGESMKSGFTLDYMLNLFEIGFDGNMPKPRAMGAYAEKADEGSFVFRDVVYGDRVFDVSFGAITYQKDAVAKEGVITIIHDVTGRYELDRSRREFVANVSHELRTPLTSIKGACESILEDPDMPPEIRDHFLDMAVAESDRMKRIVEDLLVLSRLDNNRTRWRIETYSPVESLRHVCEAMRTVAEARRHAITLRAAKDLPDITADRERIEQVMINIIANAVKYTPEGGRIVVTLRCDSFRERIRVDIADNGAGIPEEDLAHVFERFYRVEKSRASEEGGTGLGLAIAREIVLAHGGSISINSKVGEGTVVTIFLPVKTQLKNSEDK